MVHLFLLTKPQTFENVVLLLGCMIPTILVATLARQMVMFGVRWTEFCLTLFDPLCSAQLMFTSTCQVPFHITLHH
jgi:hypothetical protein